MRVAYPIAGNDISSSMLDSSILDDSGKFEAASCAGMYFTTAFQQWVRRRETAPLRGHNEKRVYAVGDSYRSAKSSIIGSTSPNR